MSGKKCRMFNYDITTNNYYVMSIVTLFYNRHIRAFSNACANVRYQALLSLPPPPFESLDSRLGVIGVGLGGCMVWGWWEGA